MHLSLTKCKRTKTANGDTVMQRRDFLKGSSLLAASLAMAGRSLYSAAAQAAAPAKKRIINVEYGKPIRLPGSHGDTWTTTWADDDELYSAADDTFGFNNSTDSDLAVHRLSGTPPDLRGVTVNTMAEFGKECEKKGDGAVWKASGFTCVDGVLYLSVSRHYANTGVGDKGGSPDHYWVQETWDASIVKSTDHGKTWSPRRRLDTPCSRASCSAFPTSSSTERTAELLEKTSMPLGRRAIVLTTSMQCRTTARGTTARGTTATG